MNWSRSVVDMLPFLGIAGIIQMDIQDYIQEYEISNHHNSNPQSCFQPLGQHWGRDCFASHRDGRDMPGPQPATASAKRPIPQLKTQKKHYHLSVASQLWNTHGKSRVYPHPQVFGTFRNPESQWNLRRLEKKKCEKWWWTLRVWALNFEPKKQGMLNEDYQS